MTPAGNCGARLPTVWLVRHGESVWNAEGLAQGQADAPGLTPRGRDQARQAARTLAVAGVSGVITSDLLRAVETAQIIAEVLGVELHREPRLRERALGAAEGRSAAELAAPGGGGGVANGEVVDPDAHPDGGESIRQLVGRVADYLGHLAVWAPKEPLALVTHGGVVRSALALASGAPLEEMTWPKVANADPLAVELTCTQ